MRTCIVPSCFPQWFHAVYSNVHVLDGAGNVIHRKTLPVATQWTSSCGTGVQIPASLPMNISQHRCMNQASALEALTQQRSLNSSLGDIVGSPLVHPCGQLLNVYSPERISTVVVHLNHLRPAVHRICHVADFGQSHFAMHGIHLSRRHVNCSQT
ncbi:hypothetical protein TNCV_4536161 [Trichonephila clavipes]|nr:hypothetical protein TNCV_4536161 [Trichonephila clavipes]